MYASCSDRPVKTMSLLKVDNISDVLHEFLEMLIRHVDRGVIYCSSVFESEEPGWLRASRADGRKGLVPAVYVEILP